MNTHIHPGDQLIESTLAAAQSESGRAHLPRLMKAVPVLALLLALTIATPVLAATPAINELLYRISPEAALHFRQVNLRCEDNGVTVELMAIKIVDNTAQMYIAVTGEMIDETVDMFDSYGLDTPRDSNTRCVLKTYLPESHTAVFFISYSHSDGAPIEGQKLTFYMNQLLTGKKEHHLDLTHLIPDAIPEVAGYKPNEYNGWGGHDGSKAEEFMARTLVLPPAANPVPIVDGVALSGIGYVDGTLRIQLRFKDTRRTDNHGFVYFMTPEGVIIPETNTLAFKAGDDSIQEFIFTAAIPEDATLKGEFFICDPAIQGEWAITFPLVDYGS